MNYELLKSKMDKFFQEISTEDLIKKYERLGYNFIDTQYKYKDHMAAKPIGHMNFMCSPQLIKTRLPWYRLKKHNCNDLQTKNLELFEVFLFKLHYERSPKSIF